MFQFLHICTVATVLGPSYDGTAASQAFTNPIVASSIAHAIYIAFLIFRCHSPPLPCLDARRSPQLCGSCVQLCRQLGVPLQPPSYLGHDADGAHALFPVRRSEAVSITHLWASLTSRLDQRRPLLHRAARGSLLWSASGE
jgi:hypothetical protein